MSAPTQSAPVTIDTAAAVLRYLLQGRTAAFIAGECKVHRQAVQDIGDLYGFGTEDFSTVDRRLEELDALVNAGKGAQQVDFDAVFEDDARPDPGKTILIPGARDAADPTPGSAPPSAEPTAPVDGDDPWTGDLLRRAERSPVQRTRTLAARIERELTELGARLAAEKAAVAARSKVARLEAELQAARANLPPKQAALATQDKVCDVPACSPGRLFTAPGLARHRTRMHGGGA